MRLNIKRQNYQPVIADRISSKNTTAKCLSSGFSIVEVLVAGALLMIAVIAVVAVVQKSGDLQVSGSSRFAARMFLATKFEEEYSAGKYAFVQAPAATPHQLITFGDTTNGTGCTGDYYTLIAAGNASGVPYKQITLALAWTEIDSSRDSITLTKWLSE